MSNFGRVLRLALRRRGTFALSVACALGVAVLWGGNIGAIYPVLQVVFQDQSIPDWLRSEVARSEAEAQRLAATLPELDRQIAAAAPAEAHRLRREAARRQARIEAERAGAGRYMAAIPYADRLAPQSPFTTLVVMVGLILLGTVIKDALVVANSYLVARLAERTAFDLRKRFYRRTLKMDLASFANEGTSDLLSRFTNDMNQVAAGLVALFGKMIREPLKGIACLVGAAWICWPLLVLSLAIAPPAMILIRWLAKTLKRANRRAMEEMSQIYTTLDETLRGIKVVKAFTTERQERRRFHGNSKGYLRRAMKIALYDSLAHPITEVAGIAVICLAIMAGAWLAMSGQTHLFGIPMTDRPLNLASLMVFYGLLAGVADPARKLSEVLARVQQASAAADRIYAALDREPAVRDPRRPLPLPRHSAALTFEDVSFGYQPGQDVLKHIDLCIPFGQTVAIVGPNGSGKSTLAALIPRFADPGRGVIRLDGRPLTDVRLRDLRRQIGLVTQETLLFDDSVYNNIRYGSPGATREQVIAAAKAAHAHSFIESQLPDGYQTLVGQGGGRLSGGQRQRLALARAMLRDPAIMILDEATSQVDLESEQLIHKALERFVRNRTTIIITHRLGILALADRIVVMDRGEIVDAGTHVELIGRSTIYRRLHDREDRARPAA